MIDTICTPSSTDEKAKAFVPFSIKNNYSQALTTTKNTKTKKLRPIFCQFIDSVEGRGWDGMGVARDGEG